MSWPTLFSPLLLSSSLLHIAGPMSDIRCGSASCRSPLTHLTSPSLCDLRSLSLPSPSFSLFSVLQTPPQTHRQAGIFNMEITTNSKNTAPHSITSRQLHRTIIHLISSHFLLHPPPVYPLLIPSSHHRRETNHSITLPIRTPARLPFYPSTTLANQYPARPPTQGTKPSMYPISSYPVQSTTQPTIPPAQPAKLHRERDGKWVYFRQTRYLPYLPFLACLPVFLPAYLLATSPATSDPPKK